MKIIIFAGGTGKRLWPLSRKDNPKQFHKIFGDETTLENSFNTIKQKFNVSDIFISTNENYVEHVYEVIPDLPKENLIIEPESRDTGAAVAYAMLKISKRFPDEPVVIRWQNSLIKNVQAYIGALNEAEKVFNNKEADFVYLCVPAKFPNTTVGYIHMGKKIRDLDEAISLHDFQGFKEIPDLETAKKYIKDGNYGWNPGCYISTPRFVLNNLEAKAPQFYSLIKQIGDALGTKEEEAVTRKNFSKLEKVSIDYLLWEKLDHKGIDVVLADYDWHYVSTWADLKNSLSANPEENVVRGLVKTLNTNNSLVYNEVDGKLVAVIGLEGVAVVQTEDAVLVVSKDQAAKVKDLLEDEGLKGFV